MDIRGQLKVETTIKFPNQKHLFGLSLFSSSAYIVPKEIIKETDITGLKLLLELN